MYLRKTLVTCAALALAVGTGAVSAQAQFAGTTGTNHYFIGTSAGPGSEYKLTTDVVFNFLTASTYYSVAAGTNVNAVLTLSGFTSGNATASGSTVYQSLADVTESITALSGPHTNLLTMTGASGLFTGSGSTASITLTGTNMFTSDYYHLGGTQSADTELKIVGGAPLHLVGNSIHAFRAESLSNVFHSSSVPEASTLLGLGGLLVGGGLLGLRRRKA